MTEITLEGYRLSPQQERLWLLQQESGASAAFRASCQISILGELSREELETVLRSVVSRHEILRTSFHRQPGARLAYQVIAEEVDLLLSHHDLRGEERAEQSLSEIFEQLTLSPPDLSVGPVVRAVLGTVAPGSHALFLDLPGLCADGASLCNLAREIAGELESARGGAEVLGEPVQYADVAEWQHELLESPDTLEGRKFWRDRSPGELPDLELSLPLEAPAPEPSPFTPRALPVTVPRGLRHRLQEIALDNGCELASLFLVCWRVLLQRLTQRSDLVIGVAYEGRRMEELQGAVGLFSRYLPLKVAAEEHLGFVELLGQTEKEAEELGGWQEYFDSRSLGGDDGGEGFEYLPFCLSYHSLPKIVTGDGTELTIDRFRVCTDRFKLNLSLFDSAGRLSAELQYDASTVSGRDAESLVRRYRTLLESVAAAPGSAVGDLHILDPAERCRLLVELNDSSEELGAEASLAELFSRQVRKTPDRTAVVSGEACLSYAALEKAAEHLAGRLRRLGAGPEVVVGLAVERSIDMVVAILGILEAGAAYLPLDPDYPRERLAYMLVDARVPVVVTQESLLGALPEIDAHVICVDRAPEDPVPLSAAASATGLAYLIYTSGSTGRPKGVMVPHRAIANRLLWMGRLLSLGSEDSVLQKTPYSFDASIWEIFVPLLAGSRLVLAAPGGHRDSAHLLEVIAREQVTILQLVPSFLAVFLQEEALEASCRSLRRVFCGGEALPDYLRERCRDSLGIELTNLYGPTETAIDASFHRCDGRRYANTVPIGRPISNVQLYLLDRQGRPVPSGFPGELHIGGAGLARGYLGRPGLTAERFVPDAFGQIAGGRLYRTGDLARLLPGGDVEFLGRLDHQVKIRGFRIELGEIEAVLAEHPEVREVVVVPRASEPSGDERLVAYAVTEGSRGTAQRPARVHELPNGLEVLFVNRNEADLIYQEIFVEETYLRHGIRLGSDACVFDVGANIGLFTLFMTERCPAGRFYAFEPIPTIFEVLRANIEAYRLDVRLFQCGLSGRSGTASFTFYPSWSAMSGAYADTEEERQVSRAALLAQAEVGPEEADELLEARFRESQTFACPLKTLSEVIREEGIERIDLLKIDVEKSELDVLAGLEEEDWRKVQQAVVEVHDVGGRLRSVEAQFEQRGFEVTVEQDPLLRGTGIFNLYALRPDRRPAPPDAAPRRRLVAGWSSRVGSEDLLRLAAEALPDYMVPAACVLLEELPRLPNGKLDRSALPDPRASSAAARREQYVAARTRTEEILAGLWGDLLGLERVGVRENFFEVGGHSLLATQLTSRIRKLFAVDFRVRQLFERPTIEELAAELDRLGDTERSVEGPPIEPVERGGKLPLSFSQRRLWFLQQMDSGSSAYHLPSAVHLQGKLAFGALEDALRELQRRHEILRTTFPTVDGRPVQEVSEEVSARILVVDLTGLDPRDRADEVQGRSAAVAWRPFDLAESSLLRSAVFRLAPEEHRALFSMHHIVGDGWSTGILVRELMELFDAFSLGAASPLGELEIQYADFAAWQRRRLSGDLLQGELEHWKQQLAGELPVLRLPADRPRTAVLTSLAGGDAWSLPIEELEAINRLALAAGCSLFMTLLAGFEILLARYSEQRDVVVGAPVANRHRPEVEGVIGPFVNTLVLRTRWDGDPTVREFLHRVRDVTLDALAHEEMPFEELVEALQPERSASGQPLFQVMFMLQNFPNSQRFELPGLAVTATPLASETAKFDFLVELRETDRGLFCGLEYRRELFDPTTVRRLARHLASILAAMVESPDRPISELPLLSAAERHQLVEEWNDTAAAYPLELTLPALLAPKLREHPEAPAVIFAEEEWSYGDVDRFSDRVASLLSRLGVGPGTWVAVYLERCAEMVPALLGVLKSGAAYVPLDTDYPPARLRQILSSLNVRHVLSWVGGLETVASLFEAPVLSDVICLRDEPTPERATAWPFRVWLRSELEAIEDLPAAPPSGAEDLAYVIFTSGSTGVPKGVVVTHRPVINLIHWLTHRFGIDATDRLLFITSLCFDLSVFDIFGILAVGGTVHVASRQEVQDPERLVDLLYRHPITFWDSAPAALQQLVPFLPSGDAEVPPSHLRRVFLSGDWIPLTLPGSVRRAFPHAEVIALGGATEATVWSNSFRVGELDPHWVSIPYGRPMANAAYLVLDSSFRPCAVGVEGDLYIGGDCLFTGYAGNARETAVKNRPDPFARRPGDRLYHTGDRARLRADGNIEFLGRRDQQVKIRGFRIELGEIEAVLLRHRAVREAVVVARQERSGERRLVAYVVPSRTGSAEPRELRRYLAATLPEYMVPTAFVEIATVPVTANGKLDRSALPAPAVRHEERGDRPTRPGDATERLLAEIWAEMLRLEEVGIHDNFFELGGDSILSIQIVARARQAGLRIDPRDIFEHQTVASLAEVAQWTEVARHEQRPVVGPAPLAPIQRWFLDADPIAPHHFNQALLLEVELPLSTVALQQALVQLLDHHDALRARFHRDDGAWRQVVEPPGEPPSLLQVDLGSLEDEPRSRILTRCAELQQAALDLSSGPLLRACHFELGREGGGRLLLVAHHLVIDGVSWRILLEDLFHLYGRLIEGEPATLPEKTTSYPSWARSLVEARRKGLPEAEKLFWREQLAGGTVPLPRERSAGPNTVASARSVQVSLEPEWTASLLQEVPQTYRVQVRDVLLTALGRTLAAWLEAPRLLVDVEGHGREPLSPDHDLSRTIGWFTSLHPLALATGGTSLGKDLKAVKELLRRVPRGGQGYGALRYLRSEEEGSLPETQAEVVFNYLGQLDQAVAGSPVRAAGESIGATADPRQLRSHPFEVSAAVAGGELHLTWTYSENLHHRSTVERLARRYLEELRSLVAFGSEARVPGLTPSDFPLVRIDQQGVDDLVERNPSLEDLYPLSSLQEGLLFHALESEIPGVYQQLLSCTLTGALDTGAFERAWRKVVARQPILRTSFLWEGVERPWQLVHREVSWEMERQDWRDLSETQTKERLALFLADLHRRPLPLDVAPLMRQALIRTAEQEHVFVWVHHHLILDGWSVGRLIYELFELYAAERSGGEPNLPVARPFHDYIGWFMGQDWSEAEVFWRRELAGFTAPTPVGEEVPTHRAAPDDEAFRETRFDLTEEQTARLRSWAQRHKLTLATLVEGAWALLLSLYSGEEDVLFGTVSAGRPPELPGIEEMVGLFITTLPVRARVKPEASLVSWLDELQRIEAEARQFEHCSLSEIQGWSEVPPGRALFDSLVVFENYPVAELVQGQGAEEVEVRGTEFVTWNHFPLTLVAEPGEGLSMIASWSSRRFEAVGVQRLLGHLRHLLEGMPQAAPGQPIGELTPLGPAERHQVLWEWSSTEVAPRLPRLLPELLVETARRWPDRVAVTLDEQSLTYGQLDVRSAAVAGELRDLGVGPESVVGVLLPPSPELVIALVGILRAQGAYLPLQPELPAERLAYMVRDAGVEVVVTGPGLVAMTAPWSVRTVDLDRVGGEEVGGEPAARLAGPHPDGLAYVLYTSGSTGLPKAVMVNHRGLATYLDWARERYGVGRDTRAPVHSPVGFDLTVTTLFPPLVAGGGIDLLSETGDIEGFTEALAGGSFGLVKLTPAHLEALRTAAAEPPPAPRMLVVGGEALFGEGLEWWRARHPDMPVVNEYGPTETVVGCSVWQVPPGRPAAGPVPIGRAAAAARIYVLDRGLHPVPADIAGELVIGGPGVARGYLHRPALTAERFLPDPFSGKPGARMYRTGDLGHHRLDGALEFGGRIDHQLKVRGFRIEPGEVEAALREIPGVAEAVVVARQGGSGLQGLVAYLVSAATVPAAEELRRELSRRLPDYMVPARFVRLAALPLTPHGKVDRSALPDPEEPGAQEARAETGVSSEVERELAEIWAEVLGVERVGPRDDFFALGGDSILGLQIASRARRAGMKLATRQIFENPTVAALAAIVEEASVETPAAEQREKGEVSLTPIQRWFLDGEPVAPHHFTQAVLLELPQPADGNLLKRAAGAVAEVHGALRLRFEKGDSGWRQWYAENGDPLPVESVDLAASTPAEHRAALSEEAERFQSSLDLQKGPLARLVLFPGSGEEPDQLLFIAHHLVVDALSWGILLEDLASAYRQLSAGEPVRLPAVTTSFQRWSERLAEHARNGIAEAEREYWCRLAELEAPGLPTGGPESTPGTVEEAGFVHATLDADATGRLLRRSTVPGAEINDLLLAALVLGLARVADRRRLLLDLESHGRHDFWEGLDVSRTVGWFTVLFPVSIDLEGIVDPVAAVRAVGEQLREVPSRGLGWGLLRYGEGDAETARRLRTIEPPSVLFNYLGQLDQRLGGEGLLGRVKQAPGTPRSPRALRSHLLEVQAAVVEGSMKVGCTFNPRAHREATVKGWMESFVASLRELAGHQAEAEPVGRPQAPWVLGPVEPETLATVVSSVDSAASIEAIYPLSPQQEGMLFESLADPSRGVHVEQWSCELRGEFDSESFEQAWEKVLGRHDILRTCFVWEDLERPLQVVLSQVPLVVERYDWSALEAAERGSRVTRLLQSDGERGFDLTRPPLMRLAVVRLGEDRHRLVWTHHHILLDGWCRARVLDEVLRCYEAALRGGEPELPPAVGFREYIAWLAGRDFEEAESYWRRTLAPFDAPTPLGSVGEVPPDPGPRYRFVELDLDPAEAEALRELAQRHQLTLNTLFQAAWALVLGRYSGESRVLFGITVSGRPEGLAGIEEIVGPFLNTLPLRVDVAPRQAVSAWLRGIQAANLDLRQHESTPGTMVRDASPIPATEPLYHSIVVFENYPVPAARQALGLELPLPDIDAVRVEGARTSYAAALLVHPAPGLNVRLVYDAARLSAADAPKILEDLRAALCRIAGAPEDSVGEALAGLAAIEPPTFTPHPRVRQPGGEGRTAPRSAEERKVASVFAEVLGLPEVGIGENFFALGGHSLIATQMASRLGEALGREVPLRFIFEWPTVAELAAHLADAGAGPGNLAPIVPVPRDGELPLSFAEQRLWFLDHFDPAASTFNVPLALRARGPLSLPALEQVLGEVQRRHESLRTTFPTDSGLPLRKISPPRLLRLPLVDLRGPGGEDGWERARCLAESEARRGFDLGRGPLMRARLFRIAVEDHVLVVTVHHIVSDAWSAGVLLREVEALVSAFGAGAPSPLEALEIQYADFAYWQRHEFPRELLETQLAYWRRQLAGELAPLDLPADRPRPEVASQRGESFLVNLSEPLSDRLRQLSRSRETTLFMTLLAAFKVLLHQQTHRDDMVVGTDVANRNRIETEGLVGFFINQLALRTDLSGDPSFLTLLQRVRRVTLGAYSHQDLPFDQLVDQLGIERSIQRAPLFQVKLFVTNGPGGTPSSGETVLSPLEIELGVAQLDLTVAFRERPSGDLVGWVNFNTDLFDRVTIERLMAGYEALLEKIVERPEQRLSELEDFLAERARGSTTMRDAGWRSQSFQKLRASSSKGATADAAEGETTRSGDGSSRGDDEEVI